MNRRRQAPATPGDHHVRRALGTVVAASAAPYGYTITLWSSGALLVDAHGLPGVGDTFLLIAGGLLGFALVGSFAQGALRATPPLVVGPGHVRAGLLHWFAIGLAVGAVWLIAHIDGRVTWLLGAMAATTIYLLGAGAQLALVTGWTGGGVPATEGEGEHDAAPRSPAP